MGGPSYAQPAPVKRQDGSEIIWDWNRREFLPYDRQAEDATRAATPASVYGAPDAYGEREGTNRSPEAPTPAKPALPQARRRGGPQPYGAGSSLLTPRNDR